MMQTRLESLIEQALNIASGFILSALAWQFLVMPIWHIQSNIVENLQITAMFTVLSLVRGYCWRRWFNAKYLRSRSEASKVLQPKTWSPRR